ncbi:NACHT domain-containing protein [Actinokineospora sp. NBRC 105648]|uniref:NACHT domain-containing protein n=1 Tax=Actinokineospora sp. NBRC 105648 TaxID=3032206 RepID=UPI0024A4472B|nr:NACHT domain-containing protein [Actinokineospora sp. NBRC 105648]GLZ39002.1 ATP-binding protein [Actinokineospora sp. NBRC 105648]
MGDRGNFFDGDVAGAVVQAHMINTVVLPAQQGLPADDVVARRYREVAARALDRFEFFGVDPRGIVRRHRFDAGYVPMTLTRRGPGDGATVGAGAVADHALADHRYALVRGVAGSGKSTLLRWLGVKAALAADGTVPFVVELAHGGPPDLTRQVGQAIREVLPEGWAARTFHQGRVLLLLDGLDEVHPDERSRVEDWVESLLETYPATRCVVTTRPSGRAEQWWVDRGFQRFDLLPMSRHNIEQYVTGWHAAAESDQPDTEAGREDRERLRVCGRALLTTLSNRPTLRGMSANPLLCGLLCALHLVRGEHLPEKRKQVYDAALELLLVRWRHMRRRQRGDDTAEPAVEPPLGDEELLKLLQRLAYWLVGNRQPVFSPEVAVRRVESGMYGLRGGGDPARVWHYLAHHSGLLRELPDGSLEFVHRTFLDHLAAKEVVEEENITMLLERAEEPHWHDVVVMAGAHARPVERTRILSGLIERGRGRPDHRDALFLLAAAILEQTTVLPRQEAGAPDVRALVEHAMADLIPPRTTAAADQLAAAGPFVLDLLPGPCGLDDREAALVVRAAARIAAQWNPPGVLEKILQFTARPTSRILNELLEVWGRLGDYEGYARDVLSEIDFRRFRVGLPNGRRIEHIGHLRTITMLALRENAALHPIADLPHLRNLTLRDNQRTVLAPLRTAPSLRVLVLDRCSAFLGNAPVDLAVLPDLRRLVVSGLRTKVDLSGLAGKTLHSLRLTAGPLDNQSLPAGLHVRHLTIAAGARRVNFESVLGVRTLILDWPPDAEDLNRITALPDLRRLVAPAGELPLPELPGIEVLQLRIRV